MEVLKALNEFLSYIQNTVKHLHIDLRWWTFMYSPHYGMKTPPLWTKLHHAGKLESIAMGREKDELEKELNKMMDIIMSMPHLETFTCTFHGFPEDLSHPFLICKARSELLEKGVRMSFSDRNILSFDCRTQHFRTHPIHVARCSRHVYFA